MTNEWGIPPRVLRNAGCPRRRCCVWSFRFFLAIGDGAPLPIRQLSDPVLRFGRRVGNLAEEFEPGAPGSVSLPGRRLYGRGISSCLQMARTVPSLISRWRGTLAILCKVGLNQMLWAPPSRYKTQPWWRRWRSNSASFMLPLFRKPREQRVGKGLFPQARAGIAAPA